VNVKVYGLSVSQCRFHVKSTELILMNFGMEINEMLEMNIEFLTRKLSFNMWLNMNTNLSGRRHR
jgi:hypothetical protein